MGLVKTKHRRGKGEGLRWEWWHAATIPTLMCWIQNSPGEAVRDHREEGGHFCAHTAESRLRDATTQLLASRWAAKQGRNLRMQITPAGELGGRSIVSSGCVPVLGNLLKLRVARIPLNTGGLRRARFKNLSRNWSNTGSVRSCG